MKKIIFILIAICFFSSNTYADHKGWPHGKKWAYNCAKTTECNIIIENIKYEINPKGGFKHFGNVNGDFIIVRGSVPGTYKRLIKLRTQIRNMPKKITKPNILEVVV